MSRQRLTKREIREDPLVTATVQARAWLDQNGKYAAIAAGAIVLIGLGLWAFQNTRASSERQAAQLLGQAQFYQWSGNSTQAASLARDVIDRFGGTRSARLARLTLGDALLDLGQPAEASGALAAYLQNTANDDPLRPVAERAQAVALEDAERFSEAAARYETFARQADHEGLVAQDLMSAARCHERAGNADGARQLYEEVVNHDPTGQLASMARYKLQALGS